VLIFVGFIWKQQYIIRNLELEAAALHSKNVTLGAEVTDLLRTQYSIEKDSGNQNATPSQTKRLSASPYDGPIGNLKLLAEATKRGIVRTPVYFSSYGQFDRLSVTFIKTFGLTSQEVSLLKSHMADAQAKIESLVVSYATAARQESGSFVITVQPMAEGANVHDALLAAYRQTLGDERYQYFLQLAGDQFEQSLGYFGAQARTITINRNPGGPEQFTVEEDSKAVTSNVGRFGRTFPVANREKLEEQYRIFAHLFPPDL
jgi:hypothetical protein